MAVNTRQNGKTDPHGLISEKNGRISFDLLAIGVNT